MISTASACDVLRLAVSDTGPLNYLILIGQESLLPAIVHAGAVAADLILMDDRDGVRVGRARGFAVTGTLGLLALAGRRNLVERPDASTRLRATSFRCRPALLDALLQHHRRGRDTEN